MSLDATRWAWTQQCEAVPKLVLLRLADQADADGKCWPSAATIAVATSIAVRTVRRALASLEAAGLIKVARRKSARGADASSIYWLQIRGAGVTQRQGEGDTESPPGVTVCHPPRVTQSHPNHINKNQPTEPDQPFDIFWREYPQTRRGRRDFTLQAWQAAITRAAPEAILAGLRRFKFSADPAEVPYAGRWLDLNGWKATTIQPPPPHPPPSRPRTAAGVVLTLDDLGEMGL